jgi:hypothetical protein
MEIKIKDLVCEIDTTKKGQVVAVHTYPDGAKIMSIKFLDNSPGKWLTTEQLKKISS